VSAQGLKNAAYRIRSLKSLEEKLDAISDAFRELASALDHIERDLQAIKRATKV
jgi:outer membrane murein-binding lipoprotein Lpp